MGSQGVFHYRAGAPCAVCHVHAPDDVMDVSRSDRINATYVRTITFSVPVCVACKRHFEAPHIFGFRRWLTTEFKIAPWLKKYLISQR